MSGFQNNFLGSKYKVQIPVYNNKDLVLIDYVHFSVCLNKSRKLALFSASNNKESTNKIKRRDFRKDKQNTISTYQLGEEFYGSKTIDKSNTDDSNVFDRGHLAAKHYVDWGETKTIAEKASDDSFYYTNATPQFWKINQSPGAWNRLETFIMDKLGIKGVSVISGQIFKENDPIAVYKRKKTESFEEIQIPLKFWKVVYYIHENKLKRIAFIIKQDKEVLKLPFIKRTELKLIEAFEPDPFDNLPKSLRVYIVNIKLIENATRLKFFVAEDYFLNRDKNYLVNESTQMDNDYIDLSNVDILDYL